MVRIVLKPSINRNNKQMTIAIPKKQLPLKIRYCDDLFFKIEAFRRKNGK